MNADLPIYPLTELTLTLFPYIFSFFVTFFFAGGCSRILFFSFLFYLLSLFCSLSLFSSLLIHFLFPITPSPPPSIFLFPFFPFILWTNHIFSPPATVIFKFRQDIH